MRYSTAVPLGQGGMGQVFKAWDPSLERHVALKFLRFQDPEHRERLVREARAQARVDHPNVCRVFEVGEEDGRTFIAMEYIEGRPLDEAVRGLPIEEMVALVKTVCEAIHAAHSEGLVHRDLKPGNILVAEEEGDLVPYVLDFGIARELAVEGPTVTGQMLGTPGYIAPEQARGEVRQLDRRADLFSIGAILYELVSGRKPFPGETAAESLVALLGGEAQPLRAVAPDVPRDLETIVMKCLEHERERRYATARELAEDLGRFLRGEPVSARPTSALHRLYRRGRRHPLLAAATAAALVGLIALAAVAAHARLTAKERARQAQRFGREVERIEGLLQRAYLVPLHDVRPTFQRVRERLVWIESELATLDPASAAIGEAAVGRGYLGLGDLERARVHLERSWAAGHREPQVAWALSLTLGRLYREGIEKLDAITTPEVRQRRREQLERQLRDRALELLDQAQGEGDPSYLAASLAFFAGDLQGALGHLSSTAERAPWFYEADLLAADIHRELHRRALDAGDRDTAAAAFERATESFARAAAVGESDPRSHDGLCGTWVQALQSEFWGFSGDLSEAQQAAREACGRALTADPDLPSAHLHLATVARTAADNAIDRADGDPRPALAEAREHLSHALAGKPDDPYAHVLLGVTYRIEGNWEVRRGNDPTALLERAAASYDSAAALDPTFYNVHLSRAVIELHLGDFLRRRGGDPIPHFSRAVEASQRAATLEPELTGGHVNLGIAYGQLALAERDRGRPALPLFAAGVAALERAIEINPEFVTAHFNLAEVLLEQGDELLDGGVDPTPSVERALVLLEETEASGLEYPPIYFLRTKGETLLASRALQQGQDPGPAVARALAHAERGFSLAPADGIGLVLAAAPHLVAARWQLAREADPGEPLSNAHRLLGRALEVDAANVAALRLRGEAALLEAESLVAREADPSPALERGLEAVARALAANPGDPHGQRLKAELRRRLASSAGSSRPGELEEPAPAKLAAAEAGGSG